MCKRWAGLLLVLLVLSPALSAVDDLGDQLTETADMITGAADMGVPAAEEVRQTAAQSFGALGSVTAGGGAGLLPMWDFWLDFSSTMWTSISSTFSGLSGQQVQFDEYLVYHLLGVEPASFEQYCGVIRNEPTRDQQFNIQKEGVNDFNFMLVILLILVINLAVSFGYGHIDMIIGFATIVPVIFGILLYYSFPNDPNMAMFGLDMISISIFASTMYTLLFSGGRSESSESGAFFLVLIPVAILLVSAINHLVPYSTGFINGIITSTSTSEDIKNGLFVAFFIIGLMLIIFSIIGFIIDLAHVGNRSVAHKMLREAKKLEGVAGWDASSIAHHLSLQAGKKGAEASLKEYLESKAKLSTMKPSSLEDYTKKEGYAETETKTKELEGTFFSNMQHREHVTDRQPTLWPALTLIVGLVIFFVSLTNMGIVLPNMNMVAVYYLAALLTLIVTLTNLPHTDPMAFFEDPDTRGIIMQISHTLGYDKRANFMTMLQNMQGKVSDQKYDEEVAKMMKTMSDKAGALIGGPMGNEMYGVLTEGYERMLRAPFYQLLQVRDAIIWSVLILFMVVVIGFMTQQLPFGLNVFGLSIFGAETLTSNELACFSLHSNILSLVLWASFIVSTVIFIFRRSAFALTLLLPASIYTVLNTIFGKNQFFGIFARLGLGIFLAVASMQEITLFEPQGWTFYLQPFFAISIMAAIMFISTIFYIGETFALSTVGNISHKLLSLMGSSARKTISAIETGQIGGVLGGIFMVFSLLILIPHYMFPGGVPEWERWTAFTCTVALFVIFIAGAAKNKIATASGIFFTFTGILCFVAIFSWDMPFVAGFTFFPIAIGFFLFGGQIGT